jgi:hypothetical protein
MMLAKRLLPMAIVCVSASAVPAPQSGASIQSNIQNAQEVILTIINDLAQERSAAAAFAGLQSCLTPLVTFPCPASAPLPVAKTSTEAIQYLQEVQLELNIVSLAIEDANTADAQAGVCTALGFFTAAGAFIKAS